MQTFRGTPCFINEQPKRAKPFSLTGPHQLYDLKQVRPHTTMNKQHRNYIVYKLGGVTPLNCLKFIGFLSFKKNVKRIFIFRNKLLGNHYSCVHHVDVQEY